MRVLWMDVTGWRWEDFLVRILHVGKKFCTMYRHDSATTIYQELHYLFTSILEIKSPPSLAISARMASLLISAET
jgi:hypothetical protein